MFSVKLINMVSILYFYMQFVSEMTVKTASHSWSHSGRSFADKDSQGARQLGVGPRFIPRSYDAIKCITFNISRYDEV